MIQTQFGSTIKTFRYDNAFELGSSKEAQAYFQSEGILHQTTIRHTPQQNGVVERKHRHLLEVCRALLFQSNVPLHFWGHCLLTATYLINHFPSTALQGKTPYELLFKHKPSYTHLRTFDCLCFVNTPAPGRDKLEPRATPCVMIGYPSNQKGYKIFDLIHKRVFPYHLSSWNHFLGTSSLPLPVYDILFDIPVTTSYSAEHGTTNSDIQFDIPASISHCSEQNISNPVIFDNSHLHDTSSSIPDTNVSIPSPSTQSRRRSHRNTKKPYYLQDYVCNSVSNKASVSTLPVLSAKSFSSIYSGNTSITKDHNDTTTQSLFEPLTYEDATVIPAWQTAMRQEFDALIANDTWDLVTLPQGKRPIGCKWIYRIKYRADGSVERCKARLVAKGFTQKEGIDYAETFSPVVRMTTIRCLVTVAVKNHWILHQLDVNNAFLHSLLDEEVYMIPPQGLLLTDSQQVCKLKKSLYSLKQAPRQWNRRLTEFLFSLGFLQYKYDYSLFTQHLDNQVIYLIVYVDDVIITGNNSA